MRINQSTSSLLLPHLGLPRSFVCASPCVCSPPPSLLASGVRISWVGRVSPWFATITDSGYRWIQRPKETETVVDG